MKKLILAFGLVAAGTGCAPTNSALLTSPLGATDASANNNSSDASNSNASASNGSGSSSAGGTRSALAVTAPSGKPAFSICSKLAFSSSVQFPSSMTATDAEAFKLGLNLSGSFEGNTGWANLTNNFDGEGLSMGLLNQTLGTGSLEPLFVEMRDSHLAALKGAMETSRATSLLAMITTWAGAAKVEAQDKALKSMAILRGPAGDLSPDSSAAVAPISPAVEAPLSPLDIGADGVDDSVVVNPELAASAPTNTARVRAAVATPLLHSTSAAVSWAKSTLYTSSGSFLAGWSTDLTKLANTPEYVSIQLSAAANIHAAAIAAQKKVGCADLRCYLLMFDIQVQNGGLYAADLTDFAAYKKAHPSATETALLLQLVEYRLRHVRAAYVADVRSRKDAIINGSGTVHGAALNLPKQYCYTSTTKYPQ